MFLKVRQICWLITLVFLADQGFAQTSTVQWPSASRETKPWTRWWWHGSAVTTEGITTEMEAYKKAGLGGLEITPIYGVYGAEKQFVNYLSREWMDLLIHTLKEAERLDMGIDMATGTGWPFGGPWVTEADACKNIAYKSYNVQAGQRLMERVVFIQEPYLRAVGNQVYEVHDSTVATERAKGTRKEPLVIPRNEINIDQLVEPISANKNLQALALDQVKFKKPLPLQTLMAYSESGKIVELTDKVDQQGNLQWVAPGENWKLFAVFAGWHGKMVERAGPGGEGNVIDHFSSAALENYLEYFDKAFKGYDLKPLRGFFNDSYEVDDARGAADWTPLLFDEFKKRRGYDLKEHLPALFGPDTGDKNVRVLSDYRETISELVLENFTRRWKAWAHNHDAIVRNQAHGSPANILDLYATVDIPEIEGIEPLRIKMASSSANVAGKKLISSESATWLNEHFESNLADIKGAVDRFLLNGVNHIFYHGTAYSPPGEPWPGWLFYAAVHLNPRNSLWPHFSALNKYVERAQSLLQQSTPDNDVLLYYPIYDRFAAPGPEMIEHFDGVGAQFDNTSFKHGAEEMLKFGYTFDYVSDRQILHTKVEGTNLVTEGNSMYKTLILPKCKFIPLATIRKILTMAEQGTTIIMLGGPPEHVSGYSNSKENEKEFSEMLKGLTGTKNASVSYGKGRIMIGDDVKNLLAEAGVKREVLVDQGLQFLRKKSSDKYALYFVANGNSSFEGWVSIGRLADGVVLYDPLTGNIRGGKSRKVNGKLEVFLQLRPQETIFIETTNRKLTAPGYVAVKPIGTPLALEGQWKLSFTDGGPMLPAPVMLQDLTSWINLKDTSAIGFSGCGVYTVTFRRPETPAKYWMLDLGVVRESAEIMINGRSMGTLLGPDFQVVIPDDVLKTENRLEIKVCNGMANRIIQLDRSEVFWKKFYNINFPARKAENRKRNIFDAGHWQPREGGLLGPVQLWPAD